jgi:cob(I)alamin adenosyltransferase
MKIYTKTGDKGQTSLIGGSRVLKSSLRIEAYGTVDELNSWMGVLRDQEGGKSHERIILTIQDRLFTMGSILASEPGKAKMKIPELVEADITELEKMIDQMNEDLPEMRSFVLPGGHLSVSNTHVARCVCRRAERAVVDLSQSEETPEITIRYLNRLSDFLFVLARKLTLELGVKETPWKPKM